MRRALLLALALTALAAPAAHAGDPFTLGEGRSPHIALAPDGAAHIVWTDDANHVLHCRLDFATAQCSPLTTLDIGSSTMPAFVLVGDDGKVHIAMPHYVDEKTYLWTSTDGGRTFGQRTTIYGYGGGESPTEPVLGPQPGQITFAASNKSATVWAASLDASEATQTAHATLTGTGDFDFQVAPTGDGGLVAVGNDLQSIGFHRMAPGADPSDQGAWSGASPVGFGDTSRVAGSAAGAFELNTVGPTDAHMDLRRFDGAAFAKPVPVDEFGFINDIYVTAAGKVAAVWRVNNPNGNLLRLALSKDKGASYETSTIAVEDSIMSSLDIAYADADLGLAVFEGADSAAGPQRKLIRAVNTLPVESVSPNPPSIRRKTAKVPGAKLRLDVPGNCVELNSSFSASLSAKKKGGRKSRFAKIVRVDFFLGAVRLKKDKAKPFFADISTDDLKAKKTYTVRADVTVKLKSGKKVKKSVSVPVQAC